MADATGGGAGTKKPGSARRARSQTIEGKATPLAEPSGPTGTVPLDPAAPYPTVAVAATDPVIATPGKPAPTPIKAPARATMPEPIAVPQRIAEPAAAAPPPRPPAPDPARTTPAPKPAGVAPTPQPPARRAFVPALIGGVLGATLIAVLGFVAIQLGYLGGGAEITRLSQRIAAIEAQRPRVEALEGALPRLNALSGRLDETRTALEGARAEIGQLVAATRALDARIVAAPTAGAPVAPEALVQDVARLRQSLSALEQRLGRLDAAQIEAGLRETRAEIARLSQAVGTSAQRNAALAVAAAALKTAIDRGGPFQLELDALRTLGASGDLAALAPHASTGLPNAAVLAARFRSLARPMLEATRPRAEGALGQVLQSASRLVTVRPTGEVAGADPAAILARLEAKLGRGDLAGALADYLALPEPARQAGESFGSALAARVAADRVVDAVTADILKSMPPRG